MSTNAVIASFVAIIVIIGAGYLLLKPRPSLPDYAAPAGQTVPPATDQAANASDAASAGVGVSAATPVVVTLTDSGFSPETITIKKGQAVTFVNQSKSGMWVASDPHPTHQGYDGTTRTEHCVPGYEGAAPFDECTVANQFTFTFQQVGSWGYHNHVIDEQHGTVIVTQ
ncbi:MAG TPA: hypothetical protein VF439_01440 [Candidatus Paceibacterota bacterium]